jgi:hypothetical protein
MASGCTARTSEQSALAEDVPQSTGVGPEEEESSRQVPAVAPAPTTAPLDPTPTAGVEMEEGPQANTPLAPPTSQRVPDANVEFVRAVQATDDSWTFHVTVRHPDEGWEDYADGWDVLLPDGTVLKRMEDDPFTRLLLHPHETEQPFTRSQSGLTIPGGVTQVTVRAHDLVDGFGGQEIVVLLATRSGPGFEVERAP